MRVDLAGCVALLLCLVGCGARTNFTDGDAGTLPPPAPDPGVDSGHCDESDADFDGHASIACGGDDCNDFDPTIHPGAVEDLAWRSAEIEQGLSAQYAAPLTLAPNGDLHAVYLSRKNAIRARHVRHAWLPAGAAEWETEQMIREGDGMEGDHGEPSLAIDAAGTQHLLYVRRPQADDGNILASELTHARRGDGWTYQVIDRREDSAIMSPQIAVDAAGAVHASYWMAGPEGGDPEDGEVRYATNASGAWVAETVVEGAWPGAAGSLAVDAGGMAHLIAFTGPGTDPIVSYFTNSGGGWVAEGLAAVGPDGAALALDGEGRPWVVVATPDGAAAILERDGPNSWGYNDTGVQGGVARVAAAQGPDQGRDFFFTVYTADIDPVPLRYAARTDSGWAVEAVADVPRVIRQMSAVRDAMDQLHVVYLASEDSSWAGSDGETDVRYARREGADGVDRDCNGLP